MPELMAYLERFLVARSRAGDPRQRRRRRRAHRALPREQPRRPHARVRHGHRRARGPDPPGARAARHLASASSTSCTAGSTPRPSRSRSQIGLDLEAFAKAFVQRAAGADRRGRRERRQDVPARVHRGQVQGVGRGRGRQARRDARAPRRGGHHDHERERRGRRRRRSPSGSGPRTPQVDITVDSFKYDVGIYAVGALGTTVMLFVNALAGGLLTLAAPILAIVLKSKIAGDIRVQAKEKVPAAVLKAAEAMKPHFDKCIDDFAKRLSEFVSNAGNTLYKGISEILDRTMRERREAGEPGRGLQAVDHRADRPGPRHHRRVAAAPRGPVDARRSADRSGRAPDRLVMAGPPPDLRWVEGRVAAGLRVQGWCLAPPCLQSPPV